MINVAVAGATGYAGGELLRLLLSHPEVSIRTLTAGSSAGDKLAQHHPHLHPLAQATIRETTSFNLAGHDAVFFALPHGHSGKIAAQLPPETIAIDAGADHRLQSKDAWETFYGSEFAGTWAYGMPELLTAESTMRMQLLHARRIAVPGCYPTAVSLALAPLVRAQLIAAPVVIVAASGTSGAGKSRKPHLSSAEVMGSMSAYGVGGIHRHTPEIEQNLAGASSTGPSLGAVSFTPTLAPMSRGILATATAAASDSATPESVRAAFACYQEEPFVHLLPDGQWPTTSAVLGSNNVYLQVALDERSRRIIVVSAVDNLTKGTAGAAVQCLNLAMGWPETLGLPSAGVAP